MISMAVGLFYLQPLNSRDETIAKLTYALIQEQINYMRDTKRQGGGLPKTIFNLLCSQACHGKCNY